jgi:hypothetical protein
LLCECGTPEISRTASEGLGTAAADLVHDPEKWKPVFGKDHAPTQNLDLDPIQFDRIKV